ncbi:MAG: carbohydrate ABC transporter permease [Clostridia bacterium]|nr:carbohydrate ABC transporter permease [Clostridia bacterium]
MGKKESALTRKNSHSTKNSFTAVTGVMLAVLIVYALILFGLLLWALLTSFKSQDDFYGNSYKLPNLWYWNFNAILKFGVRVETETGYRSAFMPEMLLNGVLYSVGCSFVKTAVTCIVAYLCSKFRYKFSKIVYNTVIITMIIPIVGSLPAEIFMSKTFRFYDRIWGLWIMQANFLGMYFLVFHAAFNAQPNAYAEAAKIDGANNYQVLFKVSIPLVKSLFGTILLINFIAYWNDYQTPLIYLPNKPTVAFGMLKLSQTIDNFYSTTPMRMTGSVLLMTPILVLFLIFHKRMLGDLNVGGLKG